MHYFDLFVSRVYATAYVFLIISLTNIEREIYASQLRIRNFHYWKADEDATYQKRKIEIYGTVSSFGCLYNDVTLTLEEKSELQRYKGNIERCKVGIPIEEVNLKNLLKRREKYMSALLMFDMRPIIINS